MWDKLQRERERERERVDSEAWRVNGKLFFECRCPGSKWHVFMFMNCCSVIHGVSYIRVTWTAQRKAFTHFRWEEAMITFGSFTSRHWDEEEERLRSYHAQSVGASRLSTDFWHSTHSNSRPGYSFGSSASIIFHSTRTIKASRVETQSNFLLALFISPGWK